jgi:hypothetical protein
MEFVRSSPASTCGFGKVFGINRFNAPNIYFNPNIPGRGDRVSTI